MLDYTVCVYEYVLWEILNRVLVNARGGLKMIAPQISVYWWSLHEAHCLHRVLELYFKRKSCELSNRPKLFFRF